MMKTSLRSAALMTSFSLLLAISVASSDCWAFGYTFCWGLRRELPSSQPTE